MDTLKERLIWARKQKSLTQKALADAVGMKQPTYSDLETGKANSTAYLPQIAVTLGVNSYWLATGEGSPGDTEFYAKDPESFGEPGRQVSVGVAAPVTGYDEGRRQLEQLIDALPDSDKIALLKQSLALLPEQDLLEMNLHVAGLLRELSERS